MNSLESACDKARTESGIKVLHQSLEYFREVTYLLSEQVARLEVLRNNLIGSYPPQGEEAAKQQEPQNWSEALAAQIQRTEKVACDFRNLLDSLEQYI